MKNYILENSSHWHGICVTLRNLDIDSPSSYLSQIHFKACEYKNHKEAELGCGDSKSLGLEIEFKEGKETEEIKACFENIRGVYPNLRMGYEGLAVERDTKNIVQAINLAQEIDPIPSSALREIQARTKMDLTLCINQSEITELAERDQHEDALRKAFDLHQKGDQKVWTLLARLYEEKYRSARQKFKSSLEGKERTKIALAQFNEGQYESATENQINKFNATREALDNYINVIANIPDTDPKCVKLNRLAHECLLPFTGAKDEFQIKKVLQQLFVTAVKAQLPQASHFYDQLACYSGIYPSIRNIALNSSTLLEIAKEQKQQLDKIYELKEQIYESEMIAQALQKKLEPPTLVEKVRPYMGVSSHTHLENPDNARVKKTKNPYIEKIENNNLKRLPNCPTELKPNILHIGKTSGTYAGHFFPNKRRLMRTEKAKNHEHCNAF